MPRNAALGRLRQENGLSSSWRPTSTPEQELAPPNKAEKPVKIRNSRKADSPAENYLKETNTERQEKWGTNQTEEPNRRASEVAGALQEGAKAASGRRQRQLSGQAAWRGGKGGKERHFCM